MVGDILLDDGIDKPSLVHRLAAVDRITGAATWSYVARLFGAILDEINAQPCLRAITCLELEGVPQL